MNVLIVAHYFEPFNQVGAIRMTSLCQWLIEQGDKVTVIKADNKAYKEHVHDAATMHCSPDRIVTVDIDCKNHYFDELQWRRGYKRAIDSVLSKQHFDWVIFSGGPYFYFSLGDYFYKKYKINYILDYRDLWLHDSRKPTKILSKIYDLIRRKMYANIEKKGIRSAKYVLTVSPSDNNRMKLAFPQYADKFYVVRNGYDDKKLASLAYFSPKDSGVTNIAIFGKFAYYGPTYARMFLTSIKDLLASGKKVRVTHIGNREPIINQMLASMGLPDNLYSCTGSCDYLMGMTILQQADIFVSIYPVKSGLGTKLYDYIYFNKPIVLYGFKNSEATIFCKNMKNFYCCENSAEGMEAFTKVICSKEEWLDDKINISDFSRSFQWQNLYKLLLA